MAPEFRPEASRPDDPDQPWCHRADGATDLGGAAPAAGNHPGVVEWGGLVLPGDDPPRRAPGLAVSAPAQPSRHRVELLSVYPQQTPRVAPTGPLPRLEVLPRRDRAWTPWQELCFAILRDAVKCVQRPSRARHLRNRTAQQRRDDERWLFEGVPAPLPFDVVCAVLHLEPTAVRRALRRQ